MAADRAARPQTVVVLGALAVVMGWWAGCGGGHPEVRLEITEDGSRPCLGGSHLEFFVQFEDQRRKFDQFGQFFTDSGGNACAIGQMAYPDLPTGSGITVSVVVWDSSTDVKGILSQGTSAAFSVGEGSPNQQIELRLSRTISLAPGTIIARSAPSDWGRVGGVTRVAFSVRRAVDYQLVRSGFVVFEPDLHPDPFPLTISGLPEAQNPDTMIEYQLEVEGQNDQGSALRTWRGSAWLVLANGPVADVSLASQ
jgi:hypothetical protein